MNFDDSNYRKVVFCLVAVILLGIGFWMLKYRHPALFLGEPDLIVVKKQKLNESTPALESSITPADADSATLSNPLLHGTKDGRLDINTATFEEFESLPGIGPATAKRIIDYRDINGRFDIVDDIAEVHGIGDKTIEKLRDKIVAR